MKRKFSVFLILMFFIVSILTVNVYAAPFSFITSMTASSQNVEASSEVVVTVKVSNLNVGENGINRFTASIYYDTDVFEPLTDSSIEGNNDWTPTYTPGTGKVSLTNRKFVNSDEEIMQISLKVKAGLASGTQGQVRLENIVASNSGDDITASSVSTTIKVGAGTAEPPVQPIPNNVNNSTPIQLNPNVNNNTNKNTNNSTNKLTNNTLSNISNNEVENKAGNDIPYTGTESSSIAKIIIGVILIALIAYIKIERMKDIK